MSSIWIRRMIAADASSMPVKRPRGICAAMFNFCGLMFVTADFGFLESVLKLLREGKAASALEVSGTGSDLRKRISFSYKEAQWCEG